MRTKGVNGLASGSAGLGLVLWLTFINSMGTGVVTNGIYFLTKSAYGFGIKGSFALGVVLGLTYIAGAKAVGPMLNWLKRSPRHSTRGAFLLITIGCGLLCLVPLAAQFLGIRGQWPAWVLVAAYSPLTGCMWPITEAYLSGGRRGESLRRALGAFNVTWSTALVAAFWAMGPLVKEHPLSVVAGLGVLHLLTIALVAALPAEPAAHSHEDAEPHPPIYTRLLSAHRLLLPLGYLIVSTMSPFLPTAYAAMGLAVGWHTPLTATWHAARVAGFFWFQHDQRWHGRWWAPVAASVAVVIGFGLVMLATKAGPLTESVLPIVMIASGLVLLGLGVAAIYTGALYYAMAVGGAEVDAGGTHEALIGAGYTIGPGIGLAAAVATERAWLDAGAFEWIVVVAMVAVSGLTWLVIARKRRTTPGGPEAVTRVD
ncbi:MAG: hypothetical protein KF912_08555 [Phycisphaeraceae bacterium]|nr:hypothetical protein [Phycisphaeraceae bacterium]MBX3367349.1 hypothetical protein [Phycisphaeraceae bacterium]